MSNSQWEPRHFAIITLDIEGFNSPTRSDPIRAGLRTTLDGFVENALGRMGHDAAVAAQGDTGDGKWLLLDAAVPKTRILQNVMPALENDLRHHNLGANTANTLRLRVGVHHGELIAQGAGYAGEPLNHAFRIIDNDVVRNALKTGSGDLVLVLSDDFYLKVVKPGYGALRPDDFAPVPIDVKETSTIVWIRPESGARAGPRPATAVAAPSVQTRAGETTEPGVITLHDLPPTSLYIGITDVHNAALYRRRFPEAPIEQHIETALLLAEKVVIHCADPYRSRRVSEVLGRLRPCIEAADLLFLLGENANNPRTQFRGYVDYKIMQYGKSDLGQRDVDSLARVEAGATERTEELLSLSPHALIRGFSGADGFTRLVKRDLQSSEQITICDHFSASIIGQLGLSLRQLLDLSQLATDGSLSRICADPATVGRLQAEINGLAGHNSFSRQILMEAIRRATGLGEMDPLHEAFEERVSLLHLAGTTNSMPHLEITNRRDRLSPYYYGALLDHLSVLSEVPHQGSVGAQLVMELRSLPSWWYFAAYHLRLVNHIVHQTRNEPQVVDVESGYIWSRRVPEFAAIRAAVRRHWDAGARS